LLAVWRLFFMFAAIKFVEPVRSGDRLHERITILEKHTSSKPGRGIVKILTEVINDRAPR
jgi:acyl dehydratase